MPYLQLTDAGSITVQKDVKGAITHTNKGVVRRMFVVNEPFSQASTQRYTVNKYKTKIRIKQFSTFFRFLKKAAIFV